MDSHHTIHVGDGISLPPRTGGFNLFHLFCNLLQNSTYVATYTSNTLHLSNGHYAFTVLTSCIKHENWSNRILTESSSKHVIIIMSMTIQLLLNNNEGDVMVAFQSMQEQNPKGTKLC